MAVFYWARPRSSSHAAMDKHPEFNGLLV